MECAIEETGGAILLLLVGESAMFLVWQLVLWASFV